MGYPTVKADRAFTVRHDTHVLSIAADQVVEGELARYLADTAAPVTVLDPGSDGPAPAKPVEKMTAKELKEHAAANGIDLGEAKKKDEILAVVAAAAEAAGNSGEDIDTSSDEGDAGDGAAGDPA